MNILAIDPGTTLSAYCICDYDTLKPIEFGKVDNIELLNSVVDKITNYKIKNVAIEYMQSYSMGVGKSVFETCYFIGRLTDRILQNTDVEEITPIFRNDEKMGTVGSMKANDTVIRHFLIDKFAQHDFKTGKGTKDNKDWFYGFKADIWQSYCQAYILKLKMEGKL